MRKPRRVGSRGAREDVALREGADAMRPRLQGAPGAIEAVGTGGGPGAGEVAASAANGLEVSVWGDEKAPGATVGAAARHRESPTPPSCATKDG